VYNVIDAFIFMIGLENMGAGKARGGSD